MVDSKAVYLYREVDYSQYLVVDSRAVYLYREVVHSQHITQRWHHPEVETPQQH